MYGRIESITAQLTPDHPVSAFMMVNKTTHTANGDWTKIIMNAKKRGAVWCCQTHVELRS
jgi:hypothetical protein